MCKGSLAEMQNKRLLQVIKINYITSCMKFDQKKIDEVEYEIEATKKEKKKKLEMHGRHILKKI
jgi:hypothetical protein